jgi:glycosyltransferase involved in cell wall biosynthesis
LADEIIVNDGHSTDGTFEAIRDLHPKIKVFQEPWEISQPLEWLTRAKNKARERCTGDWCILLDCDEFIPEWEFDRIRSTLATAGRDVFPVRFRHFYGNYKVFVDTSLGRLPPIAGYRIHRNVDTIEVWGDGANVGPVGGHFPAPDGNGAFECHHFGEVRHAARLREKWRWQARRHKEGRLSWKDYVKDLVPGWAFRLFPHRWLDDEISSRLMAYDGPYIRAVREAPDEFVRDGFLTLRCACKA